MLSRRIRFLLRAARSDRGSNVVELAVLAPALMLMCMLILQFGLWFNARQAALAAAQAGALVAREDAAANAQWASAAQAAATSWLMMYPIASPRLMARAARTPTVTAGLKWAPDKLP